MMLKDIPRFECLLELSKHFPDLNPSACDAHLNLLRTSEDLFRVSNDFFTKHNLSKGRFLVLMLLLDPLGMCCGSLTPADLADKSNCSRATMTGLIDTLERDGLVVRTPDAQDRRMMHVKLTDQGSQLMHSILPEHFKRMSQLYSALTESEQRTLVVLLQKISERATALDPLAQNSSPSET